jgi:hypothetical protein
LHNYRIFYITGEEELLYICASLHIVLAAY